MNLDFNWWITAIELPALAGLFWLNQNGRSDWEREVKAVKDELAAYKLHVATNYASLLAVKDVEGRLTAYLIKIEAKLDRMVDRALDAPDSHAGPHPG